MNVSSTSMAQVMQNTSSSSNRSSSLTLEQQTTIEETLANYDADSLSESDAKAIVEAFQDAGIEPSSEFASALSSIGFDAKEIGDLAGMGGNAGTSGGKPAGGPPPPPPSDEELSSVTDLLESLLSSDEEDEDSTTTASTSTTSSIISGTDYDTATSSFETVMDYTSKIMRLKDDAKTEVMDMLNEYNADETNLENEQSQKNLLTSLSQILNKTDNYNTISFYA